MQYRSVTKAAARLNMAQPTLSHALTRLRHALHDDLFVRTPDGIAPTLLAQSLAALVLAAPLAAASGGEAPGVLLDFRPSGNLDLADGLDRGELDLAIGGMAAPGDRFSDLRLLHDRFIVLMRRGHPAVASGALSVPA